MNSVGYSMGTRTGNYVSWCAYAHAICLLVRTAHAICLLVRSAPYHWPLPLRFAA